MRLQQEVLYRQDNGGGGGSGDGTTTNDVPVLDVELPEEEETKFLSSLQEMQFAINRLLGTMSDNISLLEDSVREVRTARQIAAESNRTARRRMLREGNPALMVASK